MASATSISSPCNRICVVHPTARMCIGCGRSLDEIARWIALSETERSAIMAQLPARLAALSGAKDGIASARA
ncbi:MAG: DUF1289 domain-containing protein [Xanthobacteraceae bacterium]|jgi:predicted Fe-S protein YdhL (DUF1289 family)